VKGFDNLRLLDISNCGLSDWTQVMAFGRLVFLEQLILDNNRLSAVLKCPENIFQYIERLSLSFTM
jgi:Leucine-rich repeat (LRR) protein